MKTTNLYIFLLFFLVFTSCKKNFTNKNSDSDVITDYPKGLKIPENMVWVPGKVFMMGAKENDSLALSHEKPEHEVAVDGFFIDITEVTNAQFKKFVEATGYITTAEKAVNWEEMKKSLPPGTPKPADSILQPGSLVFYEGIKEVDGLNNYQQWWKWTAGANWKHPEGKNSSIEGKDNYPVVHISYQDALAYCKWANRRLPTEAEWELAATGKEEGSIFTWGNDIKKLEKSANTWNGNFPINNTKQDGYVLAAPVKSYPANSLGLYDMAGNIWEMTSDWFDVDYYEQLYNSGKTIKNPKGSANANNPENPYQKERVIKGGSFLCNASYCGSYRISARMGMTDDSSTNHVGFRTVATVSMLKNKKNGNLTCCNFKRF